MKDEPKRAGANPAPSPAAAEMDALPEDTEAELNGLIRECRILAGDLSQYVRSDEMEVEARRFLLDAVMQLVRTGSYVGDTVAKLRGGGTPNERRQRIIVERIESASAPQGGGGSGQS